MDITIGELQQMSGFWNESIMQKRKSDSSMGIGLGIIVFSLVIIGLFSMGSETSLFHTFVPTLFVCYGAFRIFIGVSANKKSKASLKKIEIFGGDKEEILEKTLEEMVRFSGEDEDSFIFYEVMGRSRGNQTIIRWKGKFNGDMVTLMKEPRDEIYFLLIEELNIETGKKVMLNDGYMRERGRGDNDGYMKDVKLDTLKNDIHAKVRFADREITCEITVESIGKYEKWKKGEYPQTTENGEPFPIWSLEDRKKGSSRSVV